MKRSSATVILIAAAGVLAFRCLAADPESVSPPAANEDAASYPATKGAVAEDQVDAQIARNIQNLGSSFDNIADAAEADLIGLGYRAAEALEKASKDFNPAVARRAGGALEKILAHTHVVLDATRQPIVGGRLEVTIRKKVTVAVPDARGHVSVFPAAGIKDPSTARFSHPEYGIAERLLWLPSPKKEFVVPLVKRNTKAYERGIRGTVLDADGKPLAGAIVTCIDVRTPGGGLIPGYVRTDAKKASIITDANGHFACYPEAGLVGESQLKSLVPARSTFSIVVEPPADSGLFQYYGEHLNTAEVRIQLERPERVHLFQSEKLGGGFLDTPSARSRTQIAYAKEADQRPTLLKFGFGVKEEKLLPGIYRGFSLNGGFWYLPIEVKADSPKELIFRRPPTVTFRGRVSDGITGKPLAGALVLGTNLPSSGTLAALTSEDWKSLHDLPPRPSRNDRALLPVRKSHYLQLVARTDAEGRYEIVQEPENFLSSLIAVEENYIPVQQAPHALKVDDEQRVEVPDLLLFPAARVLITPVGARADVPVVASWHFAKDGQPEWFGRFRDSASTQRRYLYAYEMKPAHPQAVFVPSGVNLTIGLRVPSVDDYSAVRALTSIRLKQGETLNVGDLELPTAIRLNVEVLDAQGSAVEGAVVNRIYTDGPSGMPHSTDAKGRTWFYVDRQSVGCLRVDLLSTATLNDAPNLKVPFEVGQEIIDKLYTVELTDEQLRAVRQAPN